MERASRIQLRGLGVSLLAVILSAGLVTTPVYSAGAALEATPEPDEPSGGVIGPEYVPGFNPLTGLPIENPESLGFKPNLVSLSNFPPHSRDRLAGMSMASHVWETMMGGQGMTRFQAIFYGDYLQRIDDLIEQAGEQDDFVIGPVRSVRLVYRDLKALYPDATLIGAGASPEVGAQVGEAVRVYGENPQDLSSAGLDPQSLAGLASPGANPSDYAGLMFDPRVPEGGSPGEDLALIYNLYNQVQWTYDPGSHSYLRAQDWADGSGELRPIVDHLSGEQIAFPNVLVLFTDHRFANSAKTIMDIEVLYVRDRPGLLFRDGRYFEILWSTPGGKLQISDRQGQPLALRPGASFFEVFSYESSWTPATRLVRWHSPPAP